MVIISVSASTSPIPTADPAARKPNGVDLPLNAIAASYQPRRVMASVLSITWNLSLITLLVGTGAAAKWFLAIRPAVHDQFWIGNAWPALQYLGGLFIAYAVLNFPIDFWFGYLGERRYGLAKDGVRAWTRDWLVATAQHGVMFVAGSTMIVLLQRAWPQAWIVGVSFALLALFVLTTYFSAGLIPIGLFQLQKADDLTRSRLQQLLPHITLPKIIIYSHSTLREFAGGIVGLGNRQVLLISRSTLERASDPLLRFVLLHDLGHRRYHHNLLATLAGWAWVVIGLVVSDVIIPHGKWYGVTTVGSPVYVVFLALILSLWMAIGEPVLAYFGRRLEYQADRHYLRSGGTIEEMRIALEELAKQNLARTEQMRRRETIFHPLPSVNNRLFAAKKYARQQD